METKLLIFESWTEPARVGNPGMSAELGAREEGAKAAVQGQPVERGDPTPHPGTRCGVPGVRME